MEVGLRRTRPVPARWGSIRCRRTRRSPISPGTLATRRSTNDEAVGPAPTIATSAGRCSGRDGSLSVADLSGGGQAEVSAQGGRLVLGAQHAALLQQRDDLVDEVVEAGRGQVRDEDEPVGRRRSARSRPSASATCAGVPTKVRRPMSR